MAQIHETTGEDWKSLANAYEKLTAETSSKPITDMLQRANAILPFSRATGVLDNGCGPGPVMSRLLKEYELPESCSLTCSDFSEAMVEQIRKRKERAVQEDSHSPWARVDAVVQNAMDLQSISSASVSHITAGWVYFMVPEPQKALSESLRALQDGGVLTCTAWQGSQWLDLMNLVPRVRPDKEMPKMPKEWSNVDLLKVELEKAGFRDVETHQVETRLSFESLEEVVDMLSTKLPHMIKITQDFSKEELAQLKAVMLQEGRKLADTDPGHLTGVSLVAVGRK